MRNPLPASHSMGKTTNISLKTRKKDNLFYLLFNIVLEILARESDKKK